MALESSFFCATEGYSTGTCTLAARRSRAGGPEAAQLEIDYYEERSRYA